MAEKNFPKGLEERLKEIKAKDIMTKNIITTKTDASLFDIAEIMLNKKISGLPVIDDQGNLKGIITITDIFVNMGMIKYGTFEKSNTPSVNDFLVRSSMTDKVLAISKDENLGKIIDLMIHRGIHTLPVVESGQLAGVIGRRDVIKHFYSLVKEFLSK
jgi:CBS domain-containing protein